MPDHDQATAPFTSAWERLGPEKKDDLIKCFASTTLNRQELEVACEISARFYDVGLEQGLAGIGAALGLIAKGVHNRDSGPWSNEEMNRMWARGHEFIMSFFPGEVADRNEILFVLANAFISLSECKPVEQAEEGDPR